MQVLKLNNESWINVLKAIGILAVVWGHTGSTTSAYMYLFHMPLFFFISGYLYHPKLEKSWLKFCAEKGKRLLVPYLFYLCLITFSQVLYNYLKLGYFYSDTSTIDLLLGGNHLTGYYGVFWFVTCMFFVQIIYDLLSRKLNRPMLFVSIGLLYFVTWIESRYFSNIFIPFDADVALFAICFFFVGNLFKKYDVINKRGLLLKISALVSSSVIMVLIIIYGRRISLFTVNMKYRDYSILGLNIIVPLAFAIMLVLLSILIVNYIPVVRQALGILGQGSMVIMYLHVSGLSLFKGVVLNNNFLCLCLYSDSLFIRLLFSVIATTEVTNTWKLSSRVSTLYTAPLSHKPQYTQLESIIRGLQKNDLLLVH